MPASQRPGSSCRASCCWKWCPALCCCHFLLLPGVSKEKQSGFHSIMLAAVAHHWLFQKYPFIMHFLIGFHYLAPPLSSLIKTFLPHLLSLVCRLRVFDSGVMVVQLQSHSEEEMIASALDNVSRTNAALIQMLT